LPQRVSPSQSPAGATRLFRCAHVRANRQTGGRVLPLRLVEFLTGGVSVSQQSPAIYPRRGTQPNVSYSAIWLNHSNGSRSGERLIYSHSQTILNPTSLLE